MTYLKSFKSPVVKSFDDVFSDFFRPASFLNEAKNFPPVNVTESKDKYSIELSAPGRAKESFNIKVDGNLLEISSEEKQEVKDENENYTRREFRSFSFSRTFTLPESVNAENISAEYADGILKLTLPKKEEAKVAGAKNISVK